MTNGEIDARHDVELAKAALLYADSVEMYSATMTLIGHSELFANSGPGAFGDLLAGLTDAEATHLIRSQLNPDWRNELSYLRNPQTPAHRRLAREIEEELQKVIRTFVHDSGAIDLAPAFRAGIVTQSDTVLSISGDQAEAFLVELQRLLADNSVRLLVDAETGEFAQALIDEGLVQPGTLSLKHAKEALVGSGLIARLPAFHQAPTDELLNLRSDLGGPLARYRSAVVQLSQTLTTPAFDTAAAEAVNDLWTSDVAPELVEIRESLADHGLVREIVKSAGQDVGSVIKGVAAWPAIYMGLDHMTNLSTWVAAAATAVPAASAHVGKGAVARYTGRRAITRHELFYLYETNRRLTH
ncbi:hypothetical protein OG394_15100 [Kribbella sp. NBC_01245]|uniref:hypothetical protein n=1 Tax=Kribbella sp. NBC_01245 TaxID=2903578 RepID=UPI002E2DE39F|nr:hypothetical protein [Kribbella sp. NBC_01245]